MPTDRPDRPEPAEPAPQAPDVSALSGHAVIAGFGVPGRAVADLVHAQGMSFCVIEKNLDTIERCRRSGLCMVEGDAGDADTLRRAGLDRATLFACTVPNDAAMFAAIVEARRLNPTVRIIARCRYVSSGIEAKAKGADDVVIEEHAVAQAFESLLTADPHSEAPPRVVREQ
jgi:CPA2 family monovalent cation:H+ antiporter-2